MKIIITDNYNRENIDDILVCEDIQIEPGEILCTFLNERRNDNEWFKLVSNNYPLYKYNPNK